jgi:hypothetical protein
MCSGFAFPGMSNIEIDKITKEVLLEEEISKYMFSQNLYLLTSKKRGNSISKTNSC